MHTGRGYAGSDRWFAGSEVGKKCRDWERQRRKSEQISWVGGIVRCQPRPGKWAKRTWVRAVVGAVFVRSVGRTLAGDRQLLHLPEVFAHGVHSHGPIDTLGSVSAERAA